MFVSPSRVGLCIWDVTQKLLKWTWLSLAEQQRAAFHPDWKYPWRRVRSINETQGLYTHTNKYTACYWYYTELDEGKYTIVYQPRGRALYIIRETKPTCATPDSYNYNHYYTYTDDSRLIHNYHYSKIFTKNHIFFSLHTNDNMNFYKNSRSIKRIKKYQYH